MRLRNSVSSASGTSTRNGRIALLSVVLSVSRSVTVAGVMLTSSRTHETRRATSDLSDQGIADTLVLGHGVSSIEALRRAVESELLLIAAPVPHGPRARARSRCDATNS